MQAFEDWRASRPLVCPATAREVLKRITKGMSIATAVIAFVVALSVLANTFLMNRGERGMEKQLQEQLQQQLKNLQDAVEKLAPD